jgi:hypothetical protein
MTQLKPEAFFFLSFLNRGLCSAMDIHVTGIRNGKLLPPFNISEPTKCNIFAGHGVYNFEIWGPTQTLSI